MMTRRSVDETDWPIDPEDPVASRADWYVQVVLMRARLDIKYVATLIIHEIFAKRNGGGGQVDPTLLPF